MATRRTARTTPEDLLAIEKEIEERAETADEVEDLLRIACQQQSRHAAHFFITRFCNTLDEDNPGVIVPIPPWQPVLDTIDLLEDMRLENVNGLIDKSRRMLVTWTGCAYVLWRMLHTPGFPAFMTSGRGQDYVDDGGENSTPKSLFGRLRFMHARLPNFLHKPILFAFKRAVCVENDAYVTGEAPTEQGARGGGFAFAIVDETAFLPFGDSFHTALNPACKFGRFYPSTPNGPRNVHARILKTKPDRWKIIQIDWKDHPKLMVGLEPTPEAEIQRYGPWVSPPFRDATADLRDDDIQQEYNHSLERSMKGLVYKEFNLRLHVPDDSFVYDPALGPPIVGVDYGATGFGSAVAGQWEDPSSPLRCFTDYELEGAGGAKEHAIQIADTLRRAGYKGELSEVLIVGGPDTNVSQTGSGQTIAGYFRVVGFTRIRESRLHGPGSVDRGITVVCTSLRWNRILISPRCKNLIGRIGEYRWPVERGTGEVKRATHPVHNEASHIMDAFRYLVSDCFHMETVQGKARSLHRDTELLPYSPDTPHTRVAVDRPLMVHPGRL